VARVRVSSVMMIISLEVFSRLFFMFLIIYTVLIQSKHLIFRFLFTFQKYVRFDVTVKYDTIMAGSEGRSPSQA